MKNTSIWERTDWADRLPEPRRTGLRLHFEQDVDAEVKTACKAFAHWLRTQYVFPLRVNVYVKHSAKIKAMDGDDVYGTFFGPFAIDAEPYIKIAAGNYAFYRQAEGRDNALASILHCIAHELTHYFQHINDAKLSPRGEEMQATRCANQLLRLYAETRDHP